MNAGQEGDHGRSLARKATQSKVVEPWIWLFPATYVLHLLEESLAGERFYSWTGRLTGRSIPVGAFLASSGIFWR